MARYRKIDVSMYADAKFNALSRPAPNGQSLWTYLLTGPQTTAIPGLSGIGEAALAESLDWPLEGFRKAFAEVSEKGMAKADWRARVVWVPNAVRYNPPESPNVIKGWARAWPEIPECALKLVAFTTLKAFVEGMGEGFRKAFHEAFPKGCPNQEQEQEQEQEKNLASAAAAASPAEPATPKPASASRRSRTTAPGANGASHGKPATDRSAHAAFVSHFDAGWAEHFGAKYVFLDAKDGAAVGRILKACDGDLSRAKRLASAYLADHDPFIEKTGHTIAVLASQLNRYLAAAHRADADEAPDREPSEEEIQEFRREYARNGEAGAA